MKKTTIAIIIAIITFLTSASTQAATYYIRTDGGTRTQCTGLADAAYSGTGNNQPCAWAQFRYAFTDTTYGNFSWAINGGDTLIVRGGPYRIGYQGPNPGDHGGPNPGSPNAIAMPPIPSGTSQSHTKILGENYQNCTAKSVIYAGYGAAGSFNLKGSSFVDVQCIETTDHAQCGRAGSENFCSSEAPYDDYALSGIVSGAGTANISLKNFSAHGFASRGWLGHIDGDVTIENGYIGFNVGAGIDLDDGTPSSGGTFKLFSTTVEWNGCIEEYPITSAIPSYKCFDQSSAGYGDAIGTPSGDNASWDIDKSIFRYNTQDGPDLLHSIGTGTIKITRSKSYGNMGQQVKLGDTANSILQNNFIVHNCQRLSQPFPGAPSTYNANLSNFCRASGDGIVVDLSGAGNARVENNTFVGYGSTTMDVRCGVDGPCGTTGIKSLRNNIFIGVSNPNYNDFILPGFIYYSSGNDATWNSRDHNYVYNHRNFTPTGTDSASNPGIIGPITMTTESSLDGIDLRLTPDSPAIDTASTISDLTDDIFARLRPVGAAPDVGAHEYGAEPTSGTVGASITKTGNATIYRGGGATLMRGQ